MVKNEVSEKTARELKATKAKVWIRVASELMKPTRNKPEVNVGKLDKLTKEGFTLVVPGKVLSSGNLTKKVDVAAFQFSVAAAAKIKALGGSLVSIRDFIKKNPEGKKVILIK